MSKHAHKVHGVGCRRAGPPRPCAAHWRPACQLLVALDHGKYPSCAYIVPEICDKTMMKILTFL